MNPEEIKLRALWDIGLSTLHELETDEGVLASAQNEKFGCIFGRDSLITALKILKTHEETGNPYFLKTAKKILQSMQRLQGKETNIESGEEPGKCVHEFRWDNHEHLTQNADAPWYVYPDGSMRNYDTVDATPLYLIAMHHYISLSGDQEFADNALQSVKLALFWLTELGDSNDDGFIDYRWNNDRKFGGLYTQSWMDSSESIFHEDCSPVPYPIAPVEVQAYSYAAMRLWSEYFRRSDKILSKKLNLRARRLKKLFSDKFEVNRDGSWTLGFAVDGAGRLMESPRSSIGHCLWAAVKTPGKKTECVLNDELVPRLVERLMKPDLFEKNAGIRTLGHLSTSFKADSYHNGSIWPHDTSMIIEGLMNFGYVREAEAVRTSLLCAYDFFQTPVELFTSPVNGELAEYGAACKKQAWSAASLLAETSSLIKIV